MLLVDHSKLMMIFFCWSDLWLWNIWGQRLYPYWSIRASSKSNIECKKYFWVKILAASGGFYRYISFFFFFLPNLSIKKICLMSKMGRLSFSKYGLNNIYSHMLFLQCDLWHSSCWVVRAIFSCFKPRQVSVTQCNFWGQIIKCYAFLSCSFGMLTLGN